MQMNQHAHEHHHRHDHRGFAVLRRDVQVASPRADIGRFGHRQRVGLARDEPAVEVSDHSLSNRRIPVLAPLDALLQWHVRQVDDLDGRCLASCDPQQTPDVPGAEVHVVYGHVAAGSECVPDHRVLCLGHLRLCLFDGR